MKKIMYLIGGALLGTLLGLGIVYFFNRDVFNNTIPSLFTRERTTTSDQQTISKKLDPYRVPGSETPLRETVFWKEMGDKIAGAEETTGLRQARVVHVANPLLEYEVEFLSSGERKIISISQTTKLQVPEYTFDENRSITSADFRSADDRNILNLLEENSQIMLYVEDTALLKNNGGAIPVQLLVFAD